MKQKKAVFEISEAVELIAAIPTVIVLLIVFFAIFNPTFNTSSETSKGYKKTLEKQMELAKEGETGEFYMWPLPGDDNDISYYLVYFGDKFSTLYQGRKFISEEDFETAICICSYQYRSSCKKEQCINLKGETATYKGRTEPWVLPESHSIKIRYNNGNFEFDSSINTPDTFEIGKVFWMEGTPLQEILYQGQRTTIRIEPFPNKQGYHLYQGSIYIGNVTQGENFIIDPKIKSLAIREYGDLYPGHTIEMGITFSKLEPYQLQGEKIILP